MEIDVDVSALCGKKLCSALLLKASFCSVEEVRIAVARLTWPWCNGAVVALDKKSCLASRRGLFGPRLSGWSLCRSLRLRYGHRTVVWQNMGGVVKSGGLVLRTQVPRV